MPETETLARPSYSIRMRRVVPDFELIRYIDTTKFDLAAECAACGHDTVIGVPEIISACGPNLLLGELGPRLQCRQCSARAATIVTRSLHLTNF